MARILTFIFCIIILASSCKNAGSLLNSFEKRRYNKGWHVDLSGKRNVVSGTDSVVSATTTPPPRNIDNSPETAHHQEHQYTPEKHLPREPEKEATYTFNEKTKVAENKKHFKRFIRHHPKIKIPVDEEPQGENPALAGIIAFIAGLSSILLAVAIPFFWIQFPSMALVSVFLMVALAITAVIFGAIGLTKGKELKGLATAGLIMGILMIIISLIYSFALFLLLLLAY